MDTLLTIKKELHNRCVLYVEGRIERAKKAMNTAQEAANSESKSSVGDKYETTRAMMQMERDRAAQQLSEGLRLKGVVHNITSEKQYNTAQLGSLIITSNTNFFIAISAGKFLIDGIEYFTISNISPIAKEFYGAKKGATMLFNGTEYQVLDIA